MKDGVRRKIRTRGKEEGKKGWGRWREKWGNK